LKAADLEGLPSGSVAFVFPDPRARPTGTPRPDEPLDLFIDAALEAEVWALDARLAREEGAA
jgi:hypothetical protein